LTYDEGQARFTVRCSLDAGHSGRHRGSAEIDFAGLELERPATGSAPSSTGPQISTR
jgi:hypothetical protein